MPDGLTIAERQYVEIEKCRLDPFYYITNYCYSNDKDNNIVALIPNSNHVKKLVNAYMSEGDEIVKKSRQLLASWITMACELHEITFKKNYAILNVSEKEEYVDDKTDESLHGKIFFIYSRLPHWLKPDIELTPKSEFPYLLVKNLSNGSVIKGVATTGNSGRSGNYNKIFVDEADFLPYGESVLAAIRMACKCGIKLVSTVSEKPITMFSRIEAGAPENGFRKQFIHWSEYRSQEWFNKVSRAMRADQIARELEGIRQGSTLALVYPSFDRKIHVKDGLFEKGLPVGLSMDFGRADLTNVKFWQDTVVETHLVDEYVDNMKTPNEYIEGIARKLATLKAIDIKALKYFTHEKNAENLNTLRKELRKIKAFGDPAGRAKEQTSGVSVISQYAEYGLIIQTQKQSDVQFGIDQTDLRLKKPCIFIDSSCTHAIDELAGYSYPVDQDGNRKIGEKPVHNELSHGADAIRYWCENNPIRTFSMHKRPEPADYYQGSYFQGARV